MAKLAVSSKSVVLGVRLTIEAHERLRAYAEARRRSMASMAGLLIEDAMNDSPAEPPTTRTGPVRGWEPSPAETEFLERLDAALADIGFEFGGKRVVRLATFRTKYKAHHGGGYAHLSKPTKLLTVARVIGTDGEHIWRL